jgi:hypothetical protein
MFCANCGDYIELKNSYRESGLCSQDCIFEYMKHRKDPDFMKKVMLDSIKKIDGSVIEFADIPEEFKVKPVPQGVW